MSNRKSGAACISCGDHTNYEGDIPREPTCGRCLREQTLRAQLAEAVGLLKALRESECSCSCGACESPSLDELGVVAFLNRLDAGEGSDG